MNDIVERLRHPSWPIDAIMNEAADEIERLRAALRAVDPDLVALIHRLSRTLRDDKDP
jgi:hypothetical protein